MYSDLIIIFICFFIIYFNFLEKERFYEIKDAPKVVYIFWTGKNKMSENRQKCYESILDNIGVKVVLVTSENLYKYVHDKYPLHPAYEYLSLNHKSDYLRTYFMHIYGGGYTDIKMTKTDWSPFFEKLNNNKNKWCNGYTEINGGSASTDPEIQKNYKNFIGNCSYIFKSNSEITKKWFDTLHKKLDDNLEKLKENPAQLCDSQNNCKNSKYPLWWAYLQGAHFHDILKPYQDKILHDLPLINTNDYR